MQDKESQSLKVAFTLQAIFGIATLAGLFLTAFGVGAWWVWAIIAATSLATIVCYIIMYRLALSGKNIRFKNEDDPRFAKFFAAYYGRNGEHQIFCKDLDWLDPPGRASIVETLKQRGAQAEVFLSHDKADACIRLRTNEVRIGVIPEDVARMRIKASLYTDDNDSKDLIVQLKRGNSQAVEFSRTTDPTMIGLVETLLAACRFIADVNGR